MFIFARNALPGSEGKMVIMQKLERLTKAGAGKLWGACIPVVSLAVLYLVATTGIAFASADFSTVAQNMTTSVSRMPGLLTAIAYGLGLMLGVSAIVKIKEHVETPNQTPLRTGIIRFLVGGGLFALPMVYDAMTTTVGNAGMFTADQEFSGLMTVWTGLGNVGALNDVYINIMTSLESIPGVLTAGAYLIGLVAGVSGLLKLREHVETPEQVALKEPVIRFLTGGAMFSLPTVFEAAQLTIDGNGPIFSQLLTLIGASNLLNAGANNAVANTACDTTLYQYKAGATTFFAGGTAGDVGDVICTAAHNTASLPGLLTGLAYLFGIFLVVWGVLKLRDNVLNPQQTIIWEAVSRLLAGGAFFAMPYLMGVVANTLDGGGLLPGLNGFTNSGWEGVTTGFGLDAMMANFTADMFGPMLFALNFFGYIAGAVLLMIGISRLLKSAQEGPRGPGGIGTIMTFIVAGLLMASAPMLAAFSTTFFGTPVSATKAALAYTTGMSATEVAHAQAVVSSILMFMTVLGVVAFLRGIYIIREVAEGNQQASLMAGITHMAGGALAVNLGPVMNAVQTTLGLGGFGIQFT
jgi:hypothetical protein